MEKTVDNHRPIVYKAIEMTKAYTIDKLESNPRMRSALWSMVALVSLTSVEGGLFLGVI